MAVGIDSHSQPTALTGSVTIPSGVTAALVQMLLVNESGSPPTVSGMTLGSGGDQKTGSIVSGSDLNASTSEGFESLAFFFDTLPPTGSQSYAISLSAGNSNDGGPLIVITWLTGSGITARGAAAAHATSAGTSSVDVPTESGDLVVVFVAGWDSTAPNAAPVGSGQTASYAASTVSFTDGAVGYEVASTTTTNISASGDVRNLVAVALYEAVTGFVPSSRTPATASTQVVQSPTISMTFPAAISAGSGTLTLYNAADDSTIESWAVGAGSISSATWTAPALSAPLAYGTSCYIQYPSGFVTRTSDSEPCVAVSDETTWAFAVRWGIEYVNASASTADGTTSLSVAYPSSISSGRYLLTIVGQKPSSANGGTLTDPTSPACTRIGQITGATDGNTGGYTTTLAADTGNVNLYALREDTVDGSESGSLSITLGTSNVAWGVMLQLDADSGTFDVAVVVGKDTSAGTPIAATMGSDPGLQAGDLVIIAQCNPTDVGTAPQWSSFTLTGTGLTTVGDWQSVAQPDSGTGNDIGGFIAVGRVLAGTSSAAPTVGAAFGSTTTNATRGPVMLIRVRRSSGDISGAASITLGGATVSSAGSLTLSGQASISLGGAALSSASTLALVGSLAKDLDGATVASVGVNNTRGALAVTLDNVSVSAAGVLPIVGSLSASLDGATASSVGQLPLVADAAKTLDGASLSSTGEVDISGALSVALDGATLASAGTLGAQATGALSVTLDGATLAAACELDLEAELSANLDGATLASASKLELSGALASALDGAALAAQGGSGLVAEVGVALDGATLSAAAKLNLSASASIGLDGASLVSAGTVALAATAAITTDGATLSSQGAVAIVAQSAVSLDGASLSAFGALGAQTFGNLNVALDGALLSSVGTLPLFAQSSVTLGGASLSAQGALAVAAQVAAQLDGATLSASGRLPIAGAVGSTLDGASLSSTGTAETITLGQLVAALDGATVASSGQLKIAGTLGVALDGATAASAGTLPIVGDGSRTLDGASLSAEGRLALLGSASIVLAGAALAATGGEGLLFHQAPAERSFSAGQDFRIFQISAERRVFLA